MLQEVLEKLIGIKGVDSAAIVGADGALIESVADAPSAAISPELITSSFASSRALAGLLDDAQEGSQVVQAMVEYEDGPLLLMPLGSEDEPILVARLSSASALGLARFQLRKFTSDLRGALP